jgi:hypothetical protein
MKSRISYGIAVATGCFGHTHSTQAEESGPRVDAGAKIDAREESVRDGERDVERDAQRYRIKLGVGINARLGGLAPGATAGGSAGALGSLSPIGSAGLDIRIDGPVWFVVSASGGVASYAKGAESSSAWRIEPAAGLRLETPVFDFVSVSGSGLANARFSRSSYDHVTGAGTSEGGASEGFSVGGTFAASLHFRPTSFFGVRLDLELLRIGYQRTYDSWTDAADSGAFGELNASPSVALTFSF